jgi:hypothetical protein
MGNSTNYSRDEDDDDEYDCVPLACDVLRSCECCRVKLRRAGSYRTL